VKKLKSVLLATAATIAVTHVTYAADIVKAPKAPPPAPFSWTGFYIGANLGAAYHNWKFSDDGAPGSAFVFPPGTTFWDSNSWGVIAGGQIGYNLQYDRYIFGIEGDFNYLNNSASTTNSSGGLPVSAEAKAQWLATVRGRVGMMLSPTFVYVTGGVAFAKFHEAWGAAGFGLTPPLQQFVIDKVKTGPIVGVGVEHALDNHWSVKAELLKAWFSSDSATYTTSGSTYRSEFHNGLIIGRVGLNFRF